MYQGYRLYIGKSSKMITIGLFLTTFGLSSVFGAHCVISQIWLEPKIKPTHQVKLVQIPGTLGTISIICDFKKSFFRLVSTKLPTAQKLKQMSLPNAKKDKLSQVKNNTKV